MEKMIALLEEKLLELVNKQQLASEEILGINKALEVLENAKNNPDSIDKPIFKSVFSEELSSKIDDLLFFVGWFEINPEESQIKASRAELNELISSKENELKTRIDSINDNSEDLAKIEKCKAALNVLSGYNEEKFITREEIEKIDEIIDIVDSSEVVLKAYLEIAINNSKHGFVAVPFDEIPLEQIQERENVEEELQRLEPSIIDEEEQEEKKSLQEEYVTALNKFLEETRYKDVKDLMPTSLFKSVKEILARAKGPFENTDFKFLKEMIEDCGTDVLSFDDLEIFTSGYAILILDAIRDGSHEDLKRTILEYNRKYRAGLREEKTEAERFEKEYAEALRQEELENRKKEGLTKDFVPAEGLESYLELTKTVIATYGIDKFLDKRYLDSFSGLSQAEIEKATSKADYYRYCIAVPVLEIRELLLLKDNSDEIKDKLASESAELTNAINLYEEYLRTKDEQPTVYDKYAEKGISTNKIVIFDKEEFERMYELAKYKSRKQKSESDFDRDLKEIFDDLLKTTSITELFSKTHSVKVRNKDNEYGIVDYIFQHNLRLTIKVLEDPEVLVPTNEPKPNIIIVYHPVYSRQDKNDDLTASVTATKTNPDRYYEINAMFDTKTAKEEQNRRKNKKQPMPTETRVEKQKKELGVGIEVLDEISKKVGGWTL